MLKGKKEKLVLVGEGGGGVICRIPAQKKLPKKNVRGDMVKNIEKVLSSINSHLDDLFRALGWQKLCYQTLEQKSVLM